MATPNGPDPLQRAVHAGLVTHVLCVLAADPTGEGPCLTADLPPDEISRIDAQAAALLCSRWSGPVLRLAPLLYAVAAAGREEQAERVRLTLARALVGAHGDHLVRLVAVRQAEAAEPRPGHADQAAARMEQLGALLARALARADAESGALEEMRGLLRALIDRLETALVADRDGLDAKIERIIRALGVVLAEAPDQIAQAVADRAAAPAFDVEALAEALSARISALLAAQKSPPAHDVPFALARIARCVEALHEDLTVRFAAVARGAADADVSGALATNLAALQAVASEFLGVAAAVTREQDRGLEIAPMPAPPPRRLARRMGA